MFALIVALILIGCSVAYLNFRFGKYCRAINRIPGPRMLPFLGNAHAVGKNPQEILQNLLSWWRQYGSNRFRIWIGMEAYVFISDPKDMEIILTNPRSQRKSTIYDLLHPWLGQGLLTSFGSLWYSHRKMLTPSFHFKILVDFFDTMNANSSKFLSVLENVSKGEAVFDFQSLVCYLTLDIICDTAMGVNINAMDNNDSDLVKSFQYMCYSVQMRSISPLKKNAFLFKFAPEYWKYRKALQTLTNFTMGVISKRRGAMQNDTKHVDGNSDSDDQMYTRQKRAFLDTLLTSTVDGRPLTDKEILEEVSTFMFEGHDTTASAISFSIYLLSRHPKVQQKVFEEQMAIVKGDMSQPPTFADIQEMKYLDMVIKEALRMFPSVPIIGRTNEGSFDMNGTFLPDGTTFNLFVIAMGYNEKYFPDPYKFDPERFNPESRAKASPYEYVPFSAGQRNCIGQKFAMMELKSIIAKIVRAFRILPPEDGLCSKDGFEPKAPTNKYDLILSAVLTLKSDNGIMIRLQKRTN